MFNNLKELAQKNKDYVNEMKDHWLKDYFEAMNEKYKSERVGDLNGRDLYHGDWKD